MKTNLAISINPTYKCNFNCDFCYLKNLNSKPLLNLNILKQQLQQLSKLYNIQYIDIYGGEIFLLHNNYLKQLFQLSKKYTKKLYIISNLSIIKDKEWIFKDKSIYLNTSWDYIFRPIDVLKNIQLISKKYNKKITLLLTHPKLYQYKKQIVNILNNQNFQFDISLKTYYKTNYTNYQIDFQSFQKFTLYLYSNLNKNINIIFDINSNKIKHIFISPQNKIEYIEYKNNIERFSNIPQKNNNYNCLICQFYNNCLKEHQFMKTQYDCCGQKKLLIKLKQLNFRQSWKNRRKLFYLTNNITDINLKYKYNTQIINTTIQFFKNGSKLIYPAKSYYVAIIYAHLLSEYFGQDFYEMLNNNNLLNNDDQYFIPYNKDKFTYDKIIQNIFPLNYNIIKDTANFFFKEFLIDLNIQ